jgi:hypothetical protein
VVRKGVGPLCRESNVFLEPYQVYQALFRGPVLRDGGLKGSLPLFSLALDPHPGESYGRC